MRRSGEPFRLARKPAREDPRPSSTQPSAASYSHPKRSSASSDGEVSKTPDDTSTTSGQLWTRPQPSVSTAPKRERFDSSSSRMDMPSASSQISPLNTADEQTAGPRDARSRHHTANSVHAQTRSRDAAAHAAASGSGIPIQPNILRR